MNLFAIASVFGLGVVYFLAAIPTGTALGLNPFIAAFWAWAGYSAIAAAMVAVGEPARKWIGKKLRLPAEPDPTKTFWRVWLKYGLPGLALLAPVTVGPYFAALVALTLGSQPRHVVTWIALGVIPWCIAFATLVSLGMMAVPTEPPYEVAP
jgi:hypothetical protein